MRHNKHFSEAGVRIPGRPIEVLLLILITLVLICVPVDSLFEFQLLVAEEFIGSCVR